MTQQAPERAREWHPIATAPKTGMHLLVASQGVVVEAWWCHDKDDWFDGWYTDGMTFIEAPTHWQPLPAPPTGAALAPVEGASEVD